MLSIATSSHPDPTPQSRKASAIPAGAPPPIPAEAAAGLWHLCHSPGEAAALGKAAESSSLLCTLPLLSCRVLHGPSLLIALLMGCGFHFTQMDLNPSGFKKHFKSATTLLTPDQLQLCWKCWEPKGTETASCYFCLKDRSAQDRSVPLEIKRGGWYPTVLHFLPVAHGEEFEQTQAKLRSFLLENFLSIASIIACSCR